MCSFGLDLHLIAFKIIVYDLAHVLKSGIKIKVHEIMEEDRVACFDILPFFLQCVALAEPDC